MTGGLVCFLVALISGAAAFGFMLGIEAGSQLIEQLIRG